ncbi:hypothetical protein DXG03_007723 [Asterophora parasitica]|uniref:Uncharacterized protein n=1 Tax=Asterophora parasitica TaxID=117018 RepID=A0A9P7KDA2_9AGAR|nr:hypothetical protein DXG03_007723 [Asterophora parasitica]
MDRWVNVFMIRITSFPILLLIALYERLSKTHKTTNFYDTVGAVAEKLLDTLPRQLKRLTFLEGLVGSDADINTIFEIEEEFESALDTNEDAADYSTPQRQRRTSTQSGPRPSNPSGSPLHAPRLRLNSIVHRGSAAAHHFVSPLAQVFQPLPVHDAIPEEPNDKSGGSPTITTKSAPASVPVPVVSYGPASRRRLSSMHSATRGQRQLSLPDQTKEFPSTSRSLSPLPQMKRSGSPHPIDSPSSPVPASAIEDQAGESDAVWVGRLEEMERRQARIEELLVQIAKDVKRGP